MSILTIDRAIMALPNPRRYFLLALAVSAAMLGAALLFQYVGGLYPCVLCIYQRIPYVVVIGLGVVGFVASREDGSVSAVAIWIAGLCALAFLIDSGIAVFHVGVEQGWWSGTDGCVGGDIDTSSIEAMRQAILDAPAVRCDDVAWSMLGISMAGWNALGALGLGIVSLLTIRKWRRA
jgi:disulfide bond formation protein DsbB